MMNAFVQACLRWNQFHLLQLLLQLQLRLYIASTAVAFSIIIAVTKFEAIVVTKKLFLSFRKFFSLNLIYCFQQNSDLGLVSSSLLCLIVAVLSSTHFLLCCCCFVVGFFVQLLGTKLLFLSFAGFVVGQVLIDSKLLANRFHLLLVYRFHRK
jgi:hypothetical protein